MRERVPEERRRRFTSSHTEAWSARKPSPTARAIVTCFAILRRMNEDTTCSERKKRAPWRRLQRPDSTQDTSITTLARDGTRKVALATRFCLAPMISSPKRKSTACSP